MPLELEDVLEVDIRHSCYKSGEMVKMEKDQVWENRTRWTDRELLIYISEFLMGQLDDVLGMEFNDKDSYSKIQNEFGKRRFDRLAHVFISLKFFFPFLFRQSIISQRYAE